MFIFIIITILYCLLSFLIGNRILKTGIFLRPRQEAGVDRAHRGAGEDVDGDVHPRAARELVSEVRDDAGLPRSPRGASGQHQPGLHPCRRGNGVLEAHVPEDTGARAAPCSSLPGSRYRPALRHRAGARSPARFRTVENLGRAVLGVPCPRRSHRPKLPFCPALRYPTSPPNRSALQSEPRCASWTWRFPRTAAATTTAAEGTRPGCL